MKTLILVFTVFNLLLISIIYGQDDFPKWVPKDAVKTAKEYLPRIINLYGQRQQSLEDEFGLKSSEEALLCTIKYPHQIVKVDYESYKEGGSILNSEPRTWDDNYRGSVASSTSRSLVLG